MNAQFNIGMNGSMIDEQPTGVGVYSLNVINNLFHLCQEEKYKKLTVFTPTFSFLDKGLNIIKLPNVLQSSRYGKLAAFCRFIWNTFYYPIHANKFNLLISPTTHGSFFLDNQILTIHDLLSLRYKNISAHQRFYFKFLLPALVARSKIIIAVSETTKKDIVHFLKCPEQKVQVIYNGYDHTKYFVPALTTNKIYKAYGVKNYLLAVGPTYPHKNFERLIDAYYALSNETRKQIPLVIAGGKKKYTSLLKERAARLKLENDIHFIGYVNTELMPSLYSEAFAMIFPSLYEGFGLPLVEAMACGCPVITSNTSSMPEVCGDAALYFNPTEGREITTAIEKLIANEDARRELKEKGLIQSKKFSWEQTARALNKLIDKQFEFTHHKN